MTSVLIRGLAFGLSVWLLACAIGTQPAIGIAVVAIAVVQLMQSIDAEDRFPWE